MPMVDRPICKMGRQYAVSHPVSLSGHDQPQLGFRTLDLGFGSLELGFQILDFGFLDLGFRISDFRLRISDIGLDLETWTVRFEVSDLKLQT